MDRVLTLKVILAKFLILYSPVASDTYSVKIGTESHVNLVDSKFLSFTIDPKYLFSSSGKYKTKECICMASSLTPAYIRIAGPSTSQTSFHNSTISIEALKLLDDGTSPQKLSLNEYQQGNPRDGADSLSVAHEDWETFVQWAKKTGFDLVFALNNEEKTESGMWDPNTALSILTVADKADVGDIYWQLGYACNNQSIEEYLNDLETLRVITETYPLGREGRWRVVGGDITPCLAADSKSDFKDYITLSDEMFDAVFLNGNSSSQELERMSDKDRVKLLRVLSQSTTPLWLTETNHRFQELERAADWMTSLGYSAKNGFSVHFRELMEKELYEPTLSFYMALLFKNLVGEKVLNVDMDASDATIFAHCTSLRHKPVPGAVTLYGANMDAEPARFSIKLSKKEEEGDIMQFILRHDQNGNILVNGRAMYYDGDIKPVVKRVRPFKTLLINLPPKSFGFWVLANTQVYACYEKDDTSGETQYFEEALPVASDENGYSGIVKAKRSVDSYDIGVHMNSPVDFVELLPDDDELQEINLEDKYLENRLDDISNELTIIKKMYPFNQGSQLPSRNIYSNKVKRQADDSETQSKRRVKNRKQKIQPRSYKQRFSDHSSLLKSKIMSKLRDRKLGKLPKNDRNRLSKRNSRGLRITTRLKKENKLQSKETDTNRHTINKIAPKTEITNPDCESLRKRKRRSADEHSELEENNGSGEHFVHHKRFGKFRNIKHNYLDDVPEDITSENEVNDQNDGIIPVGKVLNKLKKLAHFPVEMSKKHEDHDLYEIDENTSDIDEIVLKTKLQDDGAVINISDKSGQGFLRSTIEDILSILTDLNKNLKKVWSALTFLE